MYYRVPLDPDKTYGGKNPIACLESTYGGKVIIYTDDHCYVLGIHNSDGDYYDKTDYWFHEVTAVLKSLPSNPDEGQRKRWQLDTVFRENFIKTHKIAKPCAIEYTNFLTALAVFGIIAAEQKFKHNVENKERNNKKKKQYVKKFIKKYIKRKEFNSIIQENALLIDAAIENAYVILKQDPHSAIRFLRQDRFQPEEVEEKSEQETTDTTICSVHASINRI